MDQKHPIEQYFSFKHPLTEYLPMEFVGLEDGVLTMNVDVPEHFIADPATDAVHSGFATLVLDTVLGGAVLGHIKLSQPIATVGLTTQHMRRAIKGEKLVCRARLEGVHRDMAHMSGQLSTIDGETLSTATGTFMIGTRAKPLGARL